MLSILIPVYNWDVRALIGELYEQCEALDLVYEMIVLDDDSDLSYKSKNEEVKGISNVKYRELHSNIGRAAIRNQLARESRYSWLLFIDSDCLPTNGQYIKKYVDIIVSQNPILVCGGRTYSEVPPSKEYQLHWNYGRKREALSADERTKHPSWFVHSSNMLISASIWHKVPMDEEITTYGYEDIAWGQILDELGYHILHVDNPMLHTGLKTGEDFIKDIKSSIENLAMLYKSGSVSDTRLIQAFNKLSVLKLLPAFIKIMGTLEKREENLLKSNRSNLIKLQLLKLYYFAKHIKNRS